MHSKNGGFLGRQRGAVVVTTAVSMSVLLGFAALAVDLGYLYATRTELQRAADAAALAGAGVLLTEGGVDVNGAINTAGEVAGMNSAAGESVTLYPYDVEVGRYLDPLDLSCPFVALSDDSANAVRVTAARRESDGNGISLFFANVFGISSTSLAATAVAARVPVDAADIVPIALRAPDFGPVNPDIAEQNPGKDGPSYPANGQYFEFGEEVVVFLYGKAVRPCVHLTLDLPAFNGVAETQMMLGGDMPPAPVVVGDEMTIWNEGDGDQTFGNKLEDRLQNGNPDDDTIVMPIVETTLDSRNDDGDLVGHVRIADFIGVRLDHTDMVDVQNPKFPDDPSKTITIRRLLGVVVPAIVSNAHGTSTPGEYGNNSVVMLQLVR